MATILIVDDSRFSRGRVVTALSSLGHQLVEADSGVRALECIHEAAPDLIVTDLLMPNLDGFGLLSRLREEGRQIPVIVISADIQSTSRDKATELGAVAFLNKPFSPEELQKLATEITSSAKELQSCR